MTHYILRHSEWQFNMSECKCKAFKFLHHKV